MIRDRKPTTLAHVLIDAGGPRLIDEKLCQERRIGRFLVWAVVLELTEHVDRVTNTTTRSHVDIAEMLDVTRPEVSRAVGVAVDSGILERTQEPRRGRSPELRFRLGAPVDNASGPAGEVREVVRGVVREVVREVVRDPARDPDPDPDPDLPPVRTELSEGLESRPQGGRDLEIQNPNPPLSDAELDAMEEALLEQRRAELVDGDPSVRRDFDRCIGAGLAKGRRLDTYVSADELWGRLPMSARTWAGWQNARAKLFGRELETADDVRAALLARARDLGTFADAEARIRASRHAS